MTPTQRILSQIQAAQKLSEGALEGPWSSERAYIVVRNGDEKVRIPLIVPEEGENEIARVSLDYHEDAMFANARFIAASRTLVPRLARQLQEAIKALERIEGAEWREGEREAYASEALSRIEQMARNE